MMKIALLTASLALTAAAGRVVGPCQTGPAPLLSYQGVVVNAAGQGVAGASVWVKGTHTAVTTNSNGRFILPLPVGAYTLVVDYPGCLAKETLVQRPDSLLTIQLYSTQPRAGRRR